MKKIISILMSVIILMGLYVTANAENATAPDMKVTAGGKYSQQYILNKSVMISATMMYEDAFEKFDKIIVDITCNKSVAVSNMLIHETALCRISETENGCRYEILGHDPLVTYDGAAFSFDIIAKGQPDFNVSAVGITKDGKEKKLVLAVELPNNKVYEESEIPHIVSEFQPPVFGDGISFNNYNQAFVYAPQTVNQIRHMLSSSDRKSKIVYLPCDTSVRKNVASGDVFALEFEGKLCDFVAVYVMGDANSDGLLTSADARLLLRYSAKLKDNAFITAESCDVNHDKTINAADARTVLRASAKLEKFALPVKELELGFSYNIRNLKTAGSGSYTWQYTISDPDAFEVGQSIAPPENVEIKPGTPYNQSFLFKALKTGEYKVHFELIQPWSKDVANSFDVVFVVKETIK